LRHCHRPLRRRVDSSLLLSHRGSVDRIAVRLRRHFSRRLVFPRFEPRRHRPGRGRTRSPRLVGHSGRDGDPEAASDESGEGGGSRPDSHLRLLRRHRDPDVARRRRDLHANASMTRTARTADRWLGLYAGAIALLSIGAAPFAASAAALAPPCLFRSVTGLPCPACGARHAVVALSRLDGTGAFAANPLATLGVLAFVLGGLAAGAAALFGRPLREPRWSPRSRWAALLLVLLNWLWILVHTAGSRLPSSV